MFPKDGYDLVVVHGFNVRTKLFIKLGL